MPYSPQTNTSYNFPEVRIEAPEGFQIDKENSTFEIIKFKKIETQLPKSWEELGTIKGYYVTTNSNISIVYEQKSNGATQNTFVTEQQAEASIALAKLSQLREIYRNGWVPDWNFTVANKYSIIICGTDELEIQTYIKLNYFLTFQSQEIAEQFLHNFKDLILKAKPLMS
jgi:hypothetical protein